MGGFGATIVFFSEATDLGVFFFLEDEDSVDDRDSILNLDLGEGMCDTPTDVVGMTRLPLEDYTKANQGVEGVV